MWIYLTVFGGLTYAAAQISSGTKFVGKQQKIDVKQLGFSLNADSKQVLESKRNYQAQQLSILHDVAFFLDVNEQGEVAITNNFALALCQNGNAKQGYPIVVTSHTLKNFLQNKDERVLNHIPALLSNFDIYATQAGDIYVFIPKTYKHVMATRYPSFVVAVENKFKAEKVLEIITGFALHRLVRVLSLDKNIKSHRSIELSSLFSIFLRKEDVWHHDTLLGSWNILLSGHGSHSAQIEKYIAAGSLPRLFKQVPQSLYQDVSIAGLGLDQFRTFIKFCTHDISTHFLYYRTCYGLGYNSLITYADGLINNKGNIVAGLKPNFIIAMGAIVDSQSWENSANQVKKCFACTYAQDQKSSLEPLCTMHDNQKNTINYADFFTHVHDFALKKKHAGSITQQLRTVLSSITNTTQDPYFNIANTPQVMFPGTKTFQSIALDDSVVIINDVLVKARERERKPIEITRNVEDLFILLYAQDISVPLVLNTSHIPTIISMGLGTSLQTISRIVMPYHTTVDFLYALQDFSELIPKFLYVEQLNLADNVVLRDVFLRSDAKSSDMIYRARNGYIFRQSIGQNDWVLDTCQVGSFVDNIVPNDSFVTSMVNYFSIPELRSAFLFDGLLGETITPSQKKVIQENIKKHQPIAEFRQAIIDKKIHERIQMELKKRYPFVVEEWLHATNNFLHKYYKYFPDLLSNIDKSNIRTPLGLAAWKGDEAALNAFLKLGANVNQQDTLGNTPLMWGIIGKHSPVVFTLLKHRARIDIYNEEGQQAKDLISQDDEAIKKLFDLFAVKSLDKVEHEQVLKKQEEYRMHIARVLEPYSTRFPQILLNPNMPDVPGGQTPLEVAVSEENVAAVSALLSLRANPNIPDATGYTPIMSAIAIDNPVIVEMLLHYGADLNIVNKDGKTALMLIDKSQKKVRELVDRYTKQQTQRR